MFSLFFSIWMRFFSRFFLSCRVLVFLHSLKPHLNHWTFLNPFEAFSGVLFSRSYETTPTALPFHNTADEFDVPVDACISGNISHNEHATIKTWVIGILLPCYRVCNCIESQTPVGQNQMLSLQVQRYLVDFQQLPLVTIHWIFERWWQLHRYFSETFLRES